MSRNNSKNIREDQRKRKGRKKREVFRNDGLEMWLWKLVSKPEFEHLKPERQDRKEQR